jgi:hypothetical protein
MLSLGAFWGLCKFWGLVDEMLQRCKASDGMGKLGEGSILWGGKIRGDGNAGLCFFFFNFLILIFWCASFCCGG